MANPTTNYAFAMPTNTDLVKDLPADFEIFGQAVDTQMKTNADAAIAKTIVDAKGDIIAATAADTVARLAVGTNEQVLTADSSTATGLKWATASSGGMTLISTTSMPTGAATMTLSSIPQTYKDLRVLMVGAYTNSGGDYTMRFNGDTGSNYNSAAIFTYANVSVGGSSTDVGDSFNFGFISRNSDWYKVSNSVVNIYDYTKTGLIVCDFNNSSIYSTDRYSMHGVSRYNGSAGISSITINNAANFAGGTVYLYGVK